MRWLTRLLTRRPRSESPPALWIYVACSRCGEAMRVRADRRYDLVSEMRDPGEVGPAYTLHKDIVGAQCFQRIAVDVAFDQRLQVIERRISGGRWLTEEEYHAHTTPAEISGPGASPESGASPASRCRPERDLP
jgi:hypothetical protein